MNSSGEKYSLSRFNATGGITVLLTIFFLYLAVVLPTTRIFLFSLSTVFISVMVIEFNNKAAFLTFIAASLLGLIIIPNKLLMLPYIIYFGYYGIIKSLAEKRNCLTVEWLIKYFSYNIALLIFYLLNTRILSLPLFNTDISVYILIISAEIYFLIYDYCYSIAVSYYMRLLRGIIKSK
ncbi:hypothetical protein GM661_01680 [Iocasia frigidifontis]|uniref:Uncharacterized protein n=1 Tax=Iocasia fonsfrigidae TaxID=2682810 RepID=A0A8A7K4V7_9FIRM|nr:MULTISPECIES: hypothetical protein [Halanaerobiaceae]QTL96773.1 hypothetical protein GM661_01680 [Iocasia fonsfrigidae]